MINEAPVELMIIMIIFIHHEMVATINKRAQQWLA